MNIFVAKLDYSTREEALQQLFESFGEVISAKIILDPTTFRSRGFGFVEMANEDEAYDAVENLDGALLDGRNLVVKKAEDRRDLDRDGRCSMGNDGQLRRKQL